MSDFLKQQPLILASGSQSRQKLLQSLGINFTVVPSQVNEDIIKQQHAFDTSNELARTLAAAKALAVSKRYPDYFVIAADQLCLIGNQCLDKPGTHAIATQHLRLLSGQTHQQLVACCIAKAGELQWESQISAYLTMRSLNDDMIENYLCLDKPYQSCGAYHYEGRAKWLFRQVEGSECTILGLPLLPLTEALLDLGAIYF